MFPNCSHFTTKSLQTAVYVLTSAAEGEPEDSNVGLDCMRMVNVFLTCPVLVFCVSYMGDCLGRSVKKPTGRTGLLSGFQLMQDSVTVKIKGGNNTGTGFALLPFNSDCLYC